MIRTWEIPAETTKEWVGAITVTNDGETLLGGYSISVVPVGEVAATWVAPATYTGKVGTGVFVGSSTEFALEAGLYEVQVKITGAEGDTPIIKGFGFIKAV